MLNNCQWIIASLLGIILILLFITILLLTVNKRLKKKKTTAELEKRFISDAAHELRTPLTAIRGSLEVLIRGSWDDRETTFKLIQGVYRETTRLTRLTEQLLNFSRIDSTEDFQTERVEIYPFIEEFLKTIKPIADTRELLIRGERGIYISVNPDMFKELLYNITDNAIQHTQTNGTISFDWQRENNRVQIHIGDNGEGIPEKDIPHIFEPFYRVEKSRARRRGGSGLGLSIVKEIVKLHRGDITVHSETGRGTVFTISFPLIKS